MDVQCLLIGSVLSLVGFLFHKYFIEIYNYWSNRGIPYVKGALPLIGNNISILTLREGFGDLCDKVYKVHEGRSMVGFFRFREPHLLIRDPEIVKTVLISGFSNFHTNVMSVDPCSDPLLARNPFFTHSEKWKTERSRLTVAFMSSKKLKVFFGAVRNVCVKFEKYLEDNVREGCFEAETKELFSLFTGEVVASVGFGVEGDLFTNGCGPNSFNQAITGVFDSELVNVIKQTLLFSLPVVNKVLGFSFLPKSTDRFFRRVVGEMVRMRSKDGIVGNDLFQILLDMQKAKGGEVDESGLTASLTTFFLDGYETSAITLSFFAYQVAANPHVQNKLRENVMEVLKKYDGQVTYDALSEMTYMDQALNESMRLHPALFFLVKRCVEQCKIVGHDSIECLVEPGTVMVVPVHALQTDPKFWENPQVYDPERFSEENRKNRPKTIFLPFGEGPRICIGMRFATLQIKAAMATILRTYRIQVSPKTQVPLKFKPTAMLTAVNGGLWVTFKPL